MCGDPTTESPTVYSKARGTRGKPVHASCDPSTTQERPQRPPQQRKTKTAPSTAPTRGSTAPGDDPTAAWINIPCTQCRARPGEPCTVRYSDGTASQAAGPHRERALAARKAVARR
ncbi:zinc finger domain-containing protein [Streptomyces halstedii]